MKADGIRLAITPRPRGGDRLVDDIHLLRQAGIDIIVSALTLAEAEELGLLDEGQCCKNNGLEFLSFPIQDGSVPSSFNAFDGLINSVIDYLRKGKAVGVHCRAGIGRSSMIVGCALVRNGFSVAAAFRAIQEARGCSVPDTPEQRQWVERFVSETIT